LQQEAQCVSSSSYRAGTRGGVDLRMTQ